MSDIHIHVPDWRLARQPALIDLLSIHDTDDIRRRYHLTLEGKPDRHGMVLHLASTFIQHHRLEGDARRDLEGSRRAIPWHDSASRP